MPLPRFLLSSPKILAAKTAISMIWRSPIMTAGVACEIIALSAAAWNWVDSYQWLPNATLTLAYWNKPRELDWPADKRVAQHDQRLQNTIA